MISQIAARLELLKVIARPRLEELDLDLARTGPVLEAARTAVRDGVLDYVLITAENHEDRAGPRCDWSRARAGRCDP